MEMFNSKTEHVTEVGQAVLNRSHTIMKFISRQGMTIIYLFPVVRKSTGLRMGNCIFVLQV